MNFLENQLSQNDTISTSLTTLNGQSYERFSLMALFPHRDSVHISPLCLVSKNLTQCHLYYVAICKIWHQGNILMLRGVVQTSGFNLRPLARSFSVSAPIETPISVPIPRPLSKSKDSDSLLSLWTLCCIFFNTVYSVICVTYESQCRSFMFSNSVNDKSAKTVFLENQ